MAKKTAVKGKGEQLEAQNEVVVDNVKEFISGIIAEVNEADDTRDAYKEKLTRWYKKRYGVRGTKNFPWPGCSNLHIPLVDKTIRKLKPSYVRLFEPSETMAYFEPVGPEDADKASKCEIFFDWLLKVRMRVFKPAVLMIDKMLEKGKVIVKVIYQRTVTYTADVIDAIDIPVDVMLDDTAIPEWLKVTYGLDDSETEQINAIAGKIRAGQRKIKVNIPQIDYDAPKWIVKDPLDIIVPPDTTDIQSARWICDISYFAENDLLIDAKGGKYDLGVVTEIIEKNIGKDKTKKDNTIDTEKQARTGVYEELVGSNELVRIWEICCYHDINGDKVKERCVLTICPDYPEKPLRFIEFPYEHGRWPFVEVPFEINGDSYYEARGVPEILDHLQTEMTIQHNQKIDRQTIANSLSFKYIPGVVNPSNIRFIPGQGIPVSRMDALEPLQVQNVEVSFEREEAILKAWAEEYIGVTDFGVASPLSPLSEARTKYEVQSVNMAKMQVFSLDGRIFQEAVKELFEQTWALWLQYGPDDVWVRVMNETNPLAPNQPTFSGMNVSKNEIRGNFDIRPGGRIEGTNPVLEAQEALANLQMFKGDPYINQKELRLNYLRKMDGKLANRLMLPDQMVQAGLQARQAMMAGDKGKDQIQSITGGNNQPQMGG